MKKLILVVFFIVLILKTLINIKKAIPHKVIAYKEANFIDTLPDAIGLYFVLSTFLSKFLSIISFTIQPADLIKIDPPKKRQV